MDRKAQSAQRVSEMVITFEELFRYEFDPAVTRDEDERQTREAERQQKLREFADANNGLIHHCFFQDIGAGVALTGNGKLHWVDPEHLATEEVEVLILEAKGLYRECRSLVGREDLFRCVEPLYSVINGLYATQEQCHGLPEGARGAVFAQSVRLHRDELSHAANNFARCTRRDAQLNYFFGMLYGLFISLAAGLLLLVSLLYGLDTSTQNAVPYFIFSSWLVGSLGGFVSVLTRMSRGTLQLDYSAGKSSLKILGAVRPVVGAIFGTLAYALINSRMLPLELPDDVVGNASLVLVLAFVAGFSERWAQDMLRRFDDDQLPLQRGRRDRTGAEGEIPPPTESSEGDRNVGSQPATTNRDTGHGQNAAAAETTSDAETAPAEGVQEPEKHAHEDAAS